MLKKFIWLHLIFIILPLVRSTVDCPKRDYCKCSYSAKSTILEFECTKDDLYLRVRLFQKKSIALRCGKNDSNVYDLLPALNQSFFMNNFRLEISKSCPNFDHFSVIAQKIPVPPQVELVNMNLRKLNVNFFDNEYPILKLFLVNNKFKFLDENVFDNLSQLQLIDLSGNNFKTLPVNLFKKNVNLAHFTLNNNHHDLLLKDGILANKLHLESVTMMNNSQISITFNTFKNSPHINDIELGFCNIKTLDG